MAEYVWGVRVRPGGKWSTRAGNPCAVYLVHVLIPKRGLLSECSATTANATNDLAVFFLAQDFHRVLQSAEQLDITIEITDEVRESLDRLESDSDA